LKNSTCKQADALSERAMEKERERESQAREREREGGTERNT
jgi:hypothetical protein